MPGIAENFYVCTMSGRTVVYKGMLRSAVVGEFYLQMPGSFRAGSHGHNDPTIDSAFSSRKSLALLELSFGTSAWMADGRLL